MEIIPTLIWGAAIASFTAIAVALLHIRHDKIKNRNKAFVELLAEIDSIITTACIPGDLTDSVVLRYHPKNIGSLCAAYIVTLNKSNAVYIENKYKNYEKELSMKNLKALRDTIIKINKQ